MILRLGFHPLLRWSTIFPAASMLYATLERELQPHPLHILTFSSLIRYFFQQRQHQQMNLRMLLIFLPSKDNRLIPIWTATFCKAKSALISHMLKDCSYCYSSLKLDTISAIFFSQFLEVIHPSSSSSSLEEEETFLFGFQGTEIHSSSSLPAYLSSLYSVFAASTGLVSCTYSSSYSSDQEKSEISLSFMQSSRSYFSRIGGGSFLSFSSKPSCLQNRQATAMSSISTRESVAISPVFFEKDFTISRYFSSQSTISNLKGRFQMNYLVFRSLISLIMLGVVTRRLLTARLVILLIEMKALASTITMDFRLFSIVEYMGYQQKYQFRQKGKKPDG